MKLGKLTIRTLLCAAIPAAMPAVVQAAWETPFIYESPAELFGSADLRDAGLDDVVVIDRESGLFLIGEAQPGGGVAWREPRPGGIEEADAAAFGRFGDAGELGFAVGGATANRIQVFVGDAPAVGAFPAGVGPGPFAAVPLDGGEADTDDLLASTLLNGEAEGPVRSLLRNESDGFPVVASQGESSMPAFARAAELLPGKPPLVVTRMDPADGNGDSVFLFDVAESSSISNVGSVVVAAGSRAVPGDFRGEGHAEVAVFVPGSPDFQMYEVSDDGGAVGLDLWDDRETGRPVDLIVRLPGSEGARLLVLFDGGAEARVYAFDENGESDIVDTFAPQPGGFALTGGVPAGDGDFLLFSGPEAGGPSTVFHDFRSDGAGGYAFAGDGELPVRQAGFLGANVLLYSGNPFTDLDSRLIERRNADAWTVRGGLSGSPAEALAYASVFEGPESGLSLPEERNLGEVPAEVDYVLANQPNLDTPFSVYDFDAVAAPALAAPEIQPVSGTYRQSIQVSLNPPGGAEAYYRVGDVGSWTLFDEPFGVFEDSAVQYFSRTPGGVTSPIRTATYRFSVAPHEMDSNGNGVPDFVEIYLGMDPSTSGAADGISDLAKALGLSEEEARELDLRASFDVEATVLAFFDETTPVLSGDDTRLRAFSATGTRRASGRSGSAATNPRFPAIHLANIPVDSRAGVYVLGSDGFFALDEFADEGVKGREVIAVQPVPHLTAPEVDYEYGSAGGELADEVDAWIDAALQAYEEAGREVVGIEMGPVDTLHAALLERALAGRLVAGERWSSDDLDRATLFSHRPADSDRRRITDSDLRSLETVNTERLTPLEMAEALRGALWNGDSETAALRSFAEEVHEIGAREGPDSPGAFPAPLTVFRALLQEDELPGDTTEEGGWTATELAQLAQTATDLLDVPEARSTETVKFMVRDESYLGSCLTVYSVDDGSPVRLVLRDGRPYRFPGGFPPAAGSRVEVTGFSDPARADCPGEAMEVVSLRFLAGPKVTPEDQDGNLLPDSWERFFFGNTGHSPFESADGSDYSLLQQYLEGTDPTDGTDLPAAEVESEDLSPPRVRIAFTDDGEVELDWDWSERYADQVRFFVEFADSPGGPYESHPVSADHLGSGRFEIEVPGGDSDRQYYRVFMTLESPE